MVLNTEKMLVHVPSLGFTVNWKKISLQPCQQVIFLALHFDSVTMNAHLTPQRVDKLEKAVRHFQAGKLVMAHKVQKRLGLIIAASVVIPLALLKALGRQVSKGHVEAPLVVRAYKCTRTEGRVSCSQGAVTFHTSQACTGENGQHLGSVPYKSPGGSLCCFQVAKEPLTWAWPQLISLRAIYIPGVAKREARTGPLQGEWWLHLDLVAQIWAQYRAAQVDLFSSKETTHCQEWYSLMVQRGSLGLDALLQE